MCQEQPARALSVRVTKTSHVDILCGILTVNCSPLGTDQAIACVNHAIFNGMMEKEDCPVRVTIQGDDGTATRLYSVHNLQEHGLVAVQVG